MKALAAALKALEDALGASAKPIPKCRACVARNNPVGHGRDDWPYVAALSDLKLGIEPMLCEEHQKLMALCDQPDIIEAAEEWKVFNGQTKQGPGSAS